MIQQITDSELDQINHGEIDATKNRNISSTTLFEPAIGMTTLFLSLTVENMLGNATKKIRKSIANQIECFATAIVPATQAISSLRNRSPEDKTVS